MASREYYIQVMDQIPDGQHLAKEYDSLKKVPGSYRKIAVINRPFKAYYDENGILNISLEEFLPNPDSLNHAAAHSRDFSRELAAAVFVF